MSSAPNSSPVAPSNLPLGLAPIEVGGVRVQTPVYLAPMSGVTDLPFRRLARKHVAWYSKGLPGSAEFRAGINRLFGAAEVEAAIQAFYQPLLDQGLEAVRAAFQARGHAAEDAELMAA